MVAGGKRDDGEDEFGDPIPGVDDGAVCEGCRNEIGAKSAVAPLPQGKEDYRKSYAGNADANVGVGCQAPRKGFGMSEAPSKGAANDAKDDAQDGKSSDSSSIERDRCGESDLELFESQGALGCTCDKRRDQCGK